MICSPLAYKYHNGESLQKHAKLALFMDVNADIQDAVFDVFLVYVLVVASHLRLLCA